MTAVITAGACAAPPQAHSGRPTTIAAVADDTDTEPLIGVAGNYLAGRHATADNDPAAAAQFFLTALSLQPGDLTLQRRAFLTEALAGQVDAAAALAANLPPNDPARGTADLVLAIRDLKTKRFGQAGAKLGRKPENVLDSALDPILAAWAEVGARRVDRAVAVLTNATINPAFKPLFAFHIALIQDLAGRPEQAEKAYQAAEAELGSSPRLVVAHGRFLTRQGRQAEARALYEKFLKQTPDHPVISAELHATNSGAKPARLIATPAQGAAEALYDLGSLLDRSLGGEALLYLRLTLYLDPGFDLAHLLLGSLLEKSGQWDEAAVNYDAIPPASPVYETVQIQKAMGLDGKNRTDQAIAVLDALIARRPHSQDAVVARADILRMRERFAQAAAGYDRAIQMIGAPKEQHWGLYYARGVSLERAHRWPEAERDLLLALQLNPDEPLVLNYLGYSWIEQGEHLGRAQAMIEKAASERPTDGYIVDSLGWVLFRLGHYPEAVTQLERAVELRPADPLINGHLGDAYWRVGRHLEARFQWSHALSLNPEQDIAQELKQKLSVGLPTATDGLPAKRAGERAELQTHAGEP